MTSLHPQSPSSDSRRAVVRVGARSSLIAPAIPDLIAELGVVRRMFAPTADGVGMTTRRIGLTVQHSGAVMVLPSTLVPRALAWLTGQDWDVSVIHEAHDHPPPPASHACLQAVGDVAEKARLLAVAGHRSAQITVTGWRDAERQILSLIGLFAPAPMVVIANSMGRVRRLHRVLRRVHGAEVSRTDRGGGVLVNPTRITVTTYGTAPRLSGDPNHVVILTDAADVAGRCAYQALLNVPARLGRLYGLRYADQRLSPLAEATLEVALGPTIAAPRPDGDLSVVQVRCPSQPRTKGLTGLTWKRTGLWNNGRRNQWLGQLARAVAQREVAWLAHLGMCKLDRKRVSRAAGRGVAVLVESLEQARGLQRQLCGWPILSALSALGSMEDADASPDIEHHPCSGLIVTLTHATQRGVDVGVIIRADGGAGMAMPRRMPCDQDDATVLVDVADDFDDRSSQLSKRRRAGYERRRWLPAVTSQPPFWAGPGVPIATAPLPSDGNGASQDVRHGSQDAAAASAAMAQPPRTRSGRPDRRHDDPPAESAAIRATTAESPSKMPKAQGDQISRADGVTPTLGHRPRRVRPRPKADMVTRSGATPRHDVVPLPSVGKPNGLPEGHTHAGQVASRKENATTTLGGQRHAGIQRPLHG